MKDKTKKALLAVAGIGILGVGLLGGATLFPQEVVKEKVVIQPVDKIVEVPVEVEKIVEKEVPVEVEKIVEVEDESFKKLMCDRMMFDDMSECQEEVQAEDAALKLALAQFDDENEIFDLLEDEGIISDEDEAKIWKVYDDFEDIEIVKSDFDDEEYRFKITAKIEDEDDDKKMKVEFDIEVEDGEVEIKDVKEI